MSQQHVCLQRGLAVTVGKYCTCTVGVTLSHLRRGGVGGYFLRMCVKGLSKISQEACLRSGQVFIDVMLFKKLNDGDLFSGSDFKV